QPCGVHGRLAVGARDDAEALAEVAQQLGELAALHAEQPGHHRSGPSLGAQLEQLVVSTPEPAPPLDREMVHHSCCTPRPRSSNLTIADSQTDPGLGWPVSECSRQ